MSPTEQSALRSTARWLSMLLAACMVFTLSGTSTAATPADVSSAATVAKVVADPGVAAAKLERFVVRRADGTLAFRPSTTAAAAGVAPAALTSLKASMSHTNKLVRQGVLATTKSLDVYATTASYSFQSTYSAWYWRWWGVEVHLSAYWTNKLINALNAGAGIAGLTAILCSATGVCGVVAGVAAAILAIGSGVIGFCSNSRGVVLKKPYVGPPYCHGH